MKNLSILTLASSLLFALPTWACTPDDATAKREQLAQEVSKITEQNPTSSSRNSPTPRKKQRAEIQR